MSAEIVTKNCILTFTPQSGGTWQPGSTPTMTQILAGKAKASGNEVLVDKLAWAMTACTSGADVFVTGGSAQIGAATIVAGATKIKCDSKFVILSTDAGVCAGTMNNAAIPQLEFCKCDVTFKDAGQNKVKGT